MVFISLGKSFNRVFLADFVCVGSEHYRLKNALMLMFAFLADFLFIKAGKDVTAL
jgi:hypothetical protein